MKLAVLHYHLNRGGVTKVVENHLLALDAVLPASDSWPVALLYGGRREGWPADLAERLRSIRLGLQTVPQLEYDSPTEGAAPSPQRLADEVSAALGQLGFAPADTVLHVHNHALGKNAALPGAVRRLAERGYAMLLEPHDFAEDFRPANFRHLADRLAPEDPGGWHGWLYPQASHVHYALLNDRDRAVLLAAGVDPERLHSLPNPVRKFDALPSKDEARCKLAERFGVAPEERLILYPVRGIRRKNVGEAVLYAALAPPDTVVGLTLAPLNPAEQGIYGRWKQLAEELRLPMRFELGAPGGLDFADNLAASDVILTTSVAEGFGMVFLESWLARRTLVGRDLPEITADFVRAGVRLDRLSPHLGVPVEWIGRARYRRTLEEGYRRTLSAYSTPAPTDLANQVEAHTDRDLVDFGDLDERLQEEIIRAVCSSADNRRRALDANPAVCRAVFASEADSRVSENAAAVRSHYALEPSGRRLVSLYEQVAASPREPHLRPLEHAGRILDSFLALQRFRLIRS